MLVLGQHACSAITRERGVVELFRPRIRSGSLIIHLLRLQVRNYLMHYDVVVDRVASVGMGGVVGAGMHKWTIVVL